MYRILVLCLLAYLTACSYDTDKNSDVITIDLLEALNNTKTLNLSELVDEVEYVKFETTPDCSFGLARYLITDNYIIVYEQYNPKIYIFDRNGKYIRKFGKEGNGPGELSIIENIIVFPAEDYLIVHDLSFRKIIKYRFNGEFLEEKKFTVQGGNDLAGISMIGPERFAILFKRPVTEHNNYPLIQICNKSFEIVEKLYNVNSSSSEGAYSSKRHSFYIKNDNIHFREYFFDTLKEYNGEVFIPKYHFFIKDNRPASYAQDRSSPPQFNEIWQQFEIGKYIVCNLDMPGEEEDEIIGKWIFFDKQNQKMFTLTELPWYIRESSLEPAIYNNIDGIFHVYMNDYTNHLKTHVTEDLIYKATDIIDLKTYIENNHQSDHEVIFPEKQKELIDMIKNSSENDNPILQIFHIKTD